MGVISHHGKMTADGEGQGHYMCDVKTPDGHWFASNDNEVPIQIPKSKLSKKCVVILYSKINE